MCGGITCMVQHGIGIVPGGGSMHCRTCCTVQLQTECTYLMLTICTTLYAPHAQW